MEGGRPSRGHATARHSPAHHTAPTRLPPSGATPCHHQEEQEEMLLVPLSAGGPSKRRFDTVMHCVPFLEKKKKKTRNDGDLIKKNKCGMNWRIKMQTQNCGRRRSYKGYDFSCCRWSWWEWFDRGAHVVTALKMPLQHLWVWYWRRKVKVLKSNKSKSSVHNMTQS